MLPAREFFAPLRLAIGPRLRADGARDPAGVEPAELRTLADDQKRVIDPRRDALQAGADQYS